MLFANIEVLYSLIQKWDCIMNEDVCDATWGY